VIIKNLFVVAASYTHFCSHVFRAWGNTTHFQNELKETLDLTPTCTGMSVCVYSRDEKMKESLLAAISVPLKLASKANTLWPTLRELATVANIACKSDLQVCLFFFDFFICLCPHSFLFPWAAESSTLQFLALV